MIKTKQNIFVPELIFFIEDKKELDDFLKTLDVNFQNNFGYEGFQMDGSQTLFQRTEPDCPPAYRFRLELVLSVPGENPFLKIHLYAPEKELVLDAYDFYRALVMRSGRVTEEDGLNQLN